MRKTENLLQVGHALLAGRRSPLAKASFEVRELLRGCHLHSLRLCSLRQLGLKGCGGLNHCRSGCLCLSDVCLVLELVGLVSRRQRLSLPK